MSYFVVSHLQDDTTQLLHFTERSATGYNLSSMKGCMQVVTIKSA
jgi:hypothetical protein